MSDSIVAAGLEGEMDKQELLDSIRECEKASPEKLCALRAEIARLTAENEDLRDKCSNWKTLTDSQAARLTAERDAEKALTEEMYLSMRAAQEAQAQALDRALTAESERDAAKSEIAALHELHNQRGAAVDELLRANDAAIQRAERAERAAVWAAKNGNVRIHHYRDKHKLAYFDEELNETAKIEFNGHGPDLFRALVEACEGGRDGENAV